MSDKKFGLTEGLLIAAVPLVGYWLAFLYELGYCKYFGVPQCFVEVDVPAVFICVLTLIGLLPILILFLELWLPLTKRLPRIIIQRLRRVSIVSFLSIGYIMIGQTTERATYYLLGGLMLFMLFIALVFPLITQRKTKGYLNKLEAQEVTDGDSRLASLDALENRIGVRWFLLIFNIYVLSWGVYFIGGWKAKTQRDFLVISENPETVVIKKCGSTFLTAEFNRTAKSVSTSFSIHSTSNLSLPITVENVGPLMPDSTRPFTSKPLKHESEPLHPSNRRSMSTPVD